MDKNNYDELKEILQKIPGWDKMNATARTVEACIEMARLGIYQPRWDVLREIVGKGSATQIQDGKKRALARLATMLQTFGATGAELPPEIVRSFEDIWSAAVRQAGARFEEEKNALLMQANELQKQVEGIENEHEGAKRSLEQHKTLLENTNSELSIVQNAHEKSNQIIEQLQAVITTLRENFDGERENYDEQLQKRDTELAKSVERLEGMQKHMLRQIDEARANAQQQILNNKAIYDRHESDWVRGKASLEVKISQLRQEYKEKIEEVERLNTQLSKLEVAPLIPSKTIKKAKRPHTPSLRGSRRGSKKI